MAIKRAKTLVISFVLFVAAIITLTSMAYADSLVIGQRFSGQDRYETAASISKNGWVNGAKTVVIATGENYPDALCAAPLAKMENAPILLTEQDELNKFTAEELKRLNPEMVYIVGGEGAVSEAVKSKILSIGYKVTRISGTDRYGTSAEVALKMKDAAKAVLATGENFPDALSIASWAAANRMPILLTQRDEVPKNIQDYIDSSKVGIDYVVGGTGVVSDSVMKKFPGAKRIAGNDRYGTNTAMVNTLAGDFEYSKVYIATGENFPDALSGSAMAAASKSPLLLVSVQSAAGAKAIIDSKVDKISNVYLLGGEGVVDNYSINKIMPQLVTKIDIQMPSASVIINKQMKVSANAVRANGDRVSVNAEYNAEDPSVVSIDSLANATGLKYGNTKVIASFNGLTASKDIAVRDKRLIVLDPGHGGSDGGASAKGLDGNSIWASREAVLNLQVAQKLKSKLESAGYTVTMTREGDTYMSLKDRAQFSNNLNPDLFISIHHDSLNSTSMGTSAFYSDYRPGIDTAGVYAVAGGNSPVYGLDGSRIGYLSDGRSYPFVKEVSGDIYIIFNDVQGRVSINDVMVYDRNPDSVTVQSKELAESINKNISDLGLIARGVKDENFAVVRLTNGVSSLLEVGFISNPYEFLKVSQSSFQDKVAGGIADAVKTYFSNQN